jgi:ribonucleoside-diphosphate reductase beta chain
MSKIIFDPKSTEEFHPIVGGSPDGIADFSNPSRVIYKTIWDGMLDRTWFPSQVDLSGDMEAVKHLSHAELRAYKFAFGKLIFNDSVITNRIMDNLNQYITDPIANACLARQSFEEALHSSSYAYIGDDVLKKAGLDSKEIYELFKTDPVLLKLASEINADYSMFDKDGEPTFSELSLAAISNISLEGVSFPAGFGTIWALGSKMQGSASMITEISKDELGSHLPLYANIYKHIKQDTGINVDGDAKDMLVASVDREIDYLKYSTKGVMGFNEQAINNFMYWIGNDRFRELGFKKEFPVANANDGLIKIFKSFSKLNDTKVNFFEGTVKNYSKQKLDMDF